ncbi:gliding motility lipoprotein GldH [Flavobacterium sp.]|uniref:gliding motility lipoprotein GldH n=1 Tax=Flavobacterium sp. TaxID=239 RepID=UPI00261C82AC|nr:gliding motility lipoprotein GldH [Flavobacterium sp.]
MNRRNNFLYFLGMLSLFCFVVSCDKKRVFDEYKSVGKSWDKDSVVSFDLPKLDPKKQYNLFVNIRDNNDYPYNNLFLIVALEQPNKMTLVDTLEYQMANEDGSLLGYGFTDVKESKLVYKELMTFKPGSYKVHIRHAVRQTGKVVGVKKLDGITEVGFRIEN